MIPPTELSRETNRGREVHQRLRRMGSTVHLEGLRGYEKVRTQVVFIEKEDCYLLQGLSIQVYPYTCAIPSTGMYDERAQHWKDGATSRWTLLVSRRA